MFSQILAMERLRNRVPVARRLGLAMLAMLLTAVLGGCAAGRAASTGEADAALRALDAGYGSTPDMALEGTVRISGMGVTVWVDALSRSRDSLKITLVGPFAIPFGAMSATRESFEFYKADEDIVIIGTPDRGTFEKLLMIPLEYDELVALLRGEIPRVPQPGEYDVRSDGDALLFTVRRPDHLEEIVVDPVLVVVRSYSRSRVDGDSTVRELTIAYSQFAPFGGRQLARRAAVEIGGGTQRMSVTIDEVDATIPDDTSLALDIDPSVERRRLRP